MSKKTNFYLNEVKLPVVKCKRPKFSNHRGRTWDTFIIFLDGEELRVHLDTTWGEYIYFQISSSIYHYDGLDMWAWYKVKFISSSIDDMNGKSWNIEMFDGTKSNIKTKL